MSGININADVSAGVNLLHLFPIRIKNLNVTYLAVDATVKLHQAGTSWSLEDSAKITVEDVQIVMEDKWLNYLLALMKPTYVKLIQMASDFFAR